MKHTTTLNKFLGIGALAVITAAGCADRNKNDVPDSPATQGEINKTVDNAENTISNAASKMGDAAQNAAPGIQKAVDNAGKTIESSAMSTKVKGALIANKTIDSTKINVDTSGQTVHLKGSVANQAQKKLVGTIAQQNATGYKISNELKVAGKTSPVMKKATH